jgi:hypothetical protein
MSSHNTRTAENSSDIMSISSKSPTYTSDAEVVPDDDSESETPPSSPSFSDHNSDHFDETNDIEDVQVSSSITHNVHESQRSNADVPDDAPNDQPLHTTINHNNTIEGETSQPTPAQPTPSQPAPASVVQTHAAVESATIDTQPPSASRRPKRTIRPRLHADQAEISDNDCANSDCDDPKRPGELLKCYGLGCRSKVRPCRVGRVLN